LLLDSKSLFQLWKFQNACRIAAKGTNNDGNFAVRSSPQSASLMFWGLMPIYLSIEFEGA